jgi:hypothetical protein
MQFEIAFSYALNKLLTTTLGRVHKFRAAGSVRSRTRNLVGETRVTKGWLQRWRAADGVESYEAAVEERGVLRGNVIFGSGDGRENWSRADVGGKGPDYRPAAFVAGATVAGPNG